MLLMKIQAAVISATVPDLLIDAVGMLFVWYRMAAHDVMACQLKQKGLVRGLAA